jgi:FAD:protein FMN transferase
MFRPPPCVLWVGILAPALPLAAIPGAAAQPERPPLRRTVELHGLTMGSTFTVRIVTGVEGLDSRIEGDVDTALRRHLERIDRLMSTWRPDSELSRFNRSASLAPFSVSDETFEVLRWSLELGALTGGALDVTMAPLVEAWGFGPQGPRQGLPSDAEIARLRQITGADRIALDPATRSVRKTHPDVHVDLSAIAPGYAVDRLWSELADRGFTDYLVDVGGEIRARGRNDAGDPWQIAIDRPQPEGQATQQVVPIADLAIATSGDYRRYREVDGQRVTHILDPRTGRPLTHRLASVTVVDELAIRADGLATALMVLGTRDGLALATKLDIAALFIERAGSGFVEHTTPSFEAITDAGRRGVQPVSTTLSDPAVVCWELSATLSSGLNHRTDQPHVEP